MNATQRARLERRATIELATEPEDIPVRGNALASGDDAADEACENEILARLDDGDEWAWCTVRVTARYKGVEGNDYLGCCSYENEDDFRQPGGYFDDMKARALDELAAEIEDGAAVLASLDSDEDVC